jgi:hypothetical protein
VAAEKLIRNLKIRNFRFKKQKGPLKSCKKADEDSIGKIRVKIKNIMKN